MSKKSDRKQQPSTANMPPAAKEPASSLSSQQRLEKEREFFKKKYTDLLTQVRDEKPERFTHAVFVELRDKLEALVSAHERGLPFAKDSERVLVEIARRATAARGEKLNELHAARLQELEENFEDAVNSALDEKEEERKQAFEKEKKVLREKYEKDVEYRVNVVFAEKYREDIKQAAEGIEERVTALCKRDFDAQHAENLAEIDGRVQARVEQIQTAIEASAQEKINEIERKCAVEVERQVQERLAEAQTLIEARCLVEAEARIVKIQTSLEASSQRKVDEIESRFTGELEAQVQARVTEIQTSLEATSAAQVDEQVDSKVAQLRTSIEASAQQKIAEIESKTAAQIESRVLEIKTSLEANSAAELERKVEERVVEIRASIEASAQRKIAKVESKCAEDQAKLEARTTTMAEEIDELERQNRELVRQRNLAQAAEQEAIANFNELQVQITEKDQAVEDEKAKTQAVRDELKDVRDDNTRKESHIEFIEGRLAAAEAQNETLERDKARLTRESDRFKSEKEAIELHLNQIRADGVATNTILRGIRSENDDLKAQIVTKDATIQANAPDLARIPHLESENNKVKKLYDQMVDQLMLLRRDMKKFDLKPDAYDDPAGPGAFTSIKNELGSDAGSDVGSQWSASSDDGSASDDDGLGNDSDDDAASVALASPVFLPTPVFIPATTSSHNPLSCWLSTERHALTIGGSAVAQSVNYLHRKFAHKVPMAPSTPTSGLSAQVSANPSPQGTPPPSPPASPTQSPGGGNVPPAPQGNATPSPPASPAQSPGGTTGNGQNAPPTPPMNFGVPGNKGNPPLSPPGNANDENSGDPAKEEEAKGNDNPIPRPEKAENKQPPLLLTMARSSASTTMPNTSSSDPNASEFDISSLLPDFSSDEEDTRIPIPLGTSAPSTNASAGPGVLFMNMATASGSGEGSTSAGGEASSSAASGSGPRPQPGNAYEALETIPDFSEPEVDDRVPIPLGHTPQKPVGFKHPAGSSKYQSKSKDKDKGKGKEKEIDNTKGSLSPKSKSKSKSKSKHPSYSSSTTSSPPLAYTTHRSHIHSTPSTIIPLSPSATPSLWDEIRTPRDLHTWDTYRTLLFLFLHITFYFALYVVIDTYLLGNVWIAANEGTRAAVRYVGSANRGGQGQSWVHFVFSEGTAQWIDWFAWWAMGGGEPVAYPMPG